jgi:hypothetical protein
MDIDPICPWMFLGQISGKKLKKIINKRGNFKKWKNLGVGEKLCMQNVK